MPKTSEAAGSEFWTDDTLTSLLDRCVRDRGDAPAILTAGETIGYRTLAERVDALAGGLVALGIGRGDVVALQLPNLPAFLYIVLAASRIGAVTSTIHMPYGPREAAEAIRPRRRPAGIRGGGGGRPATGGGTRFPQRLTSPRSPMSSASAVRRPQARSPSTMSRAPAPPCRRRPPPAIPM